MLANIFDYMALDFIKRNKENPFFCYIPHAFVHYGPDGLRSGDWKIVKWRRTPFNKEQAEPGNKWELYNLKDVKREACC
jgi:hypothetical protein